MLSDQPGIGRDTASTCRADRHRAQALDAQLAQPAALRWPLLVLRLRRLLSARVALRRAAGPLQEGAADGACLPARLRATLVWAEWGPVPVSVAARSAAVARIVGRRGAQRWSWRCPRDEGLGRALSACRAAKVDRRSRTSSTRLDPLHRGRARTRRPRAPRHPGGRVRRRVHLALSPQEAQRRRRRRGRATPGRPSDPGGRRGDRGGAARTRPGSWRAARISSRTPSDDVDDVLSAFDVIVFCPSPDRGSAAGDDPRDACRAALPRDRRGRRRGHDRSRVRRDLRTRKRSGRVGRRASPVSRESGSPHATWCSCEGYAEQVYAAPVVAEQIERLFETAIAGASR